MRLRRILRLRGRASWWTRRLASRADVVYAALHRHRGGIAVLYVALLLAVAYLRLFQTDLWKTPYVGIVLLHLGSSALLSLPVIAILGTGLHVLLRTTRRRLVLRIVIASVLLFETAAFVYAFDQALLAPARFFFGLSPVPFTVAYFTTRGSLARARRLLAVMLPVLAAAILPALFGRAAAEEVPGSASDELGYFAGWVAIWALGLIVWITRSVPAPNRLASWLPAASRPRAHIEGARTIALVILLPLYLSLDLASFVRVGDLTLASARKVLIRGEVFLLFEKRIAETAQDGHFTGEGRQLVPGLGMLQAKATCDATCTFTVKLDNFDSTESQDFVFNGRDLARASAGVRTVLTRLATDVGVRPAADAPPRDIYFAIKDRIESRMVTVPVVDLQLGASSARWALAVIVIAILIIVRNRIGVALRDGGASDDEPWLLLEPMDGLERAVSAGYLVSIAGTSSIVTGALVFTIESTAQAVAALAFFGLGLSLSLSVTRRLLLLRARRASALQSGHGAS